MTDLLPPSGFVPHFRKSPFTDPWEPLYSSVKTDRVVIGLYLADAHCNSRGLVHGGLIASLCDNAMGLSCGRVLTSQGRTFSGLVTVSLTTDYMGSAVLGSWMEVDTHFAKTGGSLAFADCMVFADGQPVAKAGASFKILK